MSQSIQLQVTQVGLEQSIAAAMKRVGSSSQINLGTSSKQINALSQPLGRITGQADDFSKSMAAANARVLAFGASAGIIAGVSKAMSGLLTSTIKVEKSLVEISTVLNKTGSELDKFGQDIFNVAKNTGKSFDEVAKGALELARQGLNAEDTLARLNDALILSRLSGLDATQSVEGLTAAFNSFKSSGITTAEILNKVVAAAQKYSVSERDIIEGLKRSASVANLAGVSFEELAAVITAVQEKTARGGAVIGNAFKTIFSRIQDKAVLSDLDKMGVAVTNLQGEVLPALRILENLADKMGSISQIEQADIAKKLGGVYQLDKLLAALSDLSDEASVTTGALKVMGEAGSSAYKKNAALNQTLAALLNKVTVSAEQLGAKLGEIGVTDSLKNVLGFFNGLLEGIQRILGEESGLGTMVRGLVKGLGNFLAGPGLAIFGAIILKLSKDLVQFGFASLKAFFGIGKAAKEVQNVEGAISQILTKNVNLQQQLFALEGNRAAQLRLITGALVEQEAILRKSANISSGLAKPLYNVGAKATGSGLRIGNSADGYMPAVAKESKAIKKGVGGARAGDKPVVVPNFNFGGGKKGTMVAHTGEYIVPNFNGSGGSAVFNRRMVQSMGLPSGAKKINAAGGLVPNFANKNKKEIIETGFTTAESFSKKPYAKLKNAINADPYDQFKSIINVIRQDDNISSYNKRANSILGKTDFSKNEIKVPYIFKKFGINTGKEIDTNALNFYKEQWLSSGADPSAVKGIETQIKNATLDPNDTKANKDTWLSLQGKVKGVLGEIDASKLTGQKINDRNAFFDLSGDNEVKTKKSQNLHEIVRKYANSFLSKASIVNKKTDRITGKVGLIIPSDTKLNTSLNFSERLVNAAGGFIPNFAPKFNAETVRKYADEIQKYKDPVKDFYQFPDGTGGYGSQIKNVLSRQQSKAVANQQIKEKKIEDKGFYNLNADALGGILLVSPRFGKGQGSLDTSMQIGEIPFFNQDKSMSIDKNKYIKLSGIKTSNTPSGRDLKSLRADVNELFSDGIVKLANRLYGETFDPASGGEFSAKLQSLDASKKQQLLPPAAQGDLFEAAGKVALNSFANLESLFGSAEQNRPFDFQNPEALRKVFGVNAKRGEAKRGGEKNFSSSKQVQGIVKKIFNDSEYGSSAVKSLRSQGAFDFSKAQKAVQEKNAAGGFIPNFNDYKLLKQGKDSKREILDKVSRSYLQYSKNNDNLEIKTAFSYQKGSMLGLYNNLGEIAKKSGKKLFSPIILPQRDRLKSFNENSSIDEILKAVYPQLAYREKSNSKNTKLKLYLGGNSTDLSGKNIFQQVANYFKNTSPTSPKDLLSSIEDRRVSITSLVDTFADGYIPNFAGGTPNRASENAKRLLEKLKPLTGIAKTLGFDQFLNAVLPNGVSPFEQDLVAKSLDQVIPAAKAGFQDLMNRGIGVSVSTREMGAFQSILKDLIDLDAGIPLRSGSHINDPTPMIQGLVKRARIAHKQIKAQARRNIEGGAAGGFLPNFVNPLQAAVGREMAAGVPASQIYIDKSPALKNAANPMGLMVANRRDEPAGGFQGISRARREGANPMMYGAAGGFVPNYAREPEIRQVSRASLAAGKKLSDQDIDNYNKYLKDSANALKNHGVKLNVLLKDLDAYASRINTSGKNQNKLLEAGQKLLTAYDSELKEFNKRPAQAKKLREQRAAKQAAPIDTQEKGDSNKTLIALVAFQSAISVVSGFLNEAGEGGRKLAETLQKVATTALIFGGIAFSGPIKKLKEFADELAKTRKAARDSATDGYYKGYRSGKAGEQTSGLNRMGRFGGVVGRGVSSVNETASNVFNKVRNKAAGAATALASTNIGGKVIGFGGAVGRGAGVVRRGIGAIGRGIGAAGIAAGGLLGPATLAIGAFKVAGEALSGFRTYSNAAAKSLGQISVYAAKASESLSELDKTAIEAETNRRYGVTGGTLLGSIRDLTGASALASGISGQQISNTNYRGENVQLSNVSEDTFKQIEKAFIASYVGANRTKFATAEDASGVAALQFSEKFGDAFDEFDAENIKDEIKTLSVEAQRFQKENAVAEALKQAAIKSELAARDVINFNNVLGDSANKIIKLKAKIFELKSSNEIFKALSEAGIENASNLSEFEKVAQKLGTTLQSLDASKAVQELDLIAKTTENIDNVVRTNLKDLTVQDVGLGGVYSNIKKDIISGDLDKINEAIADPAKANDLIRLFGQDYRTVLQDLTKEYRNQTVEIKNQAKEAQNNANIEAYRSALAQQTTSALESQTKQLDFQKSSLEKMSEYADKIRASTSKISDLNFEKGLIGSTQRQRLSAQIARRPELEKRVGEESLRNFQKDRISSIQSLESLIPSTLSSESQFNLKTGILDATKSIRNQNTLGGVSKEANKIYAETIQKINKAVQEETSKRSDFINEIKDSLMVGSVTFKDSVVGAAQEFARIIKVSAQEPTIQRRDELKKNVDKLKSSIDYEKLNREKKEIERYKEANRDKTDQQIEKGMKDYFSKEPDIKKYLDYEKSIEELEKQIEELNKNITNYSPIPTTMPSSLIPMLSKRPVEAPKIKTLPTSPPEGLEYPLEAARLEEEASLLEIANTTENAADELQKLTSVSRILADEFMQLKDGIPAAIAAIISQRNKSISGADLLGANYDLETQRQLAGAKSEEEANKIARDRQNKGIGQLFAEEYGKTSEEQALDLKKTIVDGSVQFKNNMIEGIMGAVEGTSSLKDGLRSAAYEFIKMINQKMMSNLVDKVVGGNVQSGTGQTSGGLAGFFSNMFASGGKVTGGSGSKDDVPAMLMGGEYVVNKKAVSKYGPKFLEAINNGTLNGYANGGMVDSKKNPYDKLIQNIYEERRSKAKKIQGGNAGFYTPGTYNTGAILGKRDLLSFATQSGTSGVFDRMTNENGYQSIALEPESPMLSVSGMRNSPQFEATQSAKQQAFDLYLQQYNAEREAKKQAKEQKKALIRQVGMLALSAALGPVINAAGSGFSAAFKGADGQGFMSQVGAGFKGIVSGGKVGNQQVGGLSNLFSSAGKAFSGDFAGAANKFKLSQIGNGNQLSDLYKSDPKFASYIDSMGGINASGAPVVTSIIPEAGRFSATKPNASIPIGQARTNYGVPYTGNTIDLGPPPADSRPSKYTTEWSKRISSGNAPGVLPSKPFAIGGTFAIGGMIPSTSGIDTVPAMLSGGEFVMNRSAVQSIGAPNLQSMNSGGTSITSEETSKELNEKLLAKLDELIGASSSTGNITINVDSSGRSTENTSGGSSEGSQNLARQIRAAVLQVINEEKRIGGTLRR